MLLALIYYHYIDTYLPNDRNDYINVVYKLKYNKITFTISDATKDISVDEAINHLKQAFPNLLIISLYCIRDLSQ